MYKKLEMLFTKIAKLISMQILCLMGGTQACAHKDTMIFPKTCCTTYHPAKPTLNCTTLIQIVNVLQFRQKCDQNS